MADDPRERERELERPAAARGQVRFRDDEGGRERASSDPPAEDEFQEAPEKTKEKKGKKCREDRLTKLFAAIAPVQQEQRAAGGVAGHKLRAEAVFGALQPKRRSSLTHYDASAPVSAEVERESALSFLADLRERRGTRTRTSDGDTKKKTKRLRRAFAEPPPAVVVSPAVAALGRQRPVPPARKHTNILPASALPPTSR